MTGIYVFAVYNNMSELTTMLMMHVVCFIALLTIAFNILSLTTSLNFISLVASVQEKSFNAAIVNFNYKLKRGFASENLYTVCGVKADMHIKSKYEFLDIIKQLKSRPYSEEDNIYKHLKLDKWMKITQYTSKFETTVILTDVSDAIFNNNLLKNLEYYDSKTKLLSVNTLKKHIEQYFATSTEPICLCRFAFWPKEKKMTFSQPEMLNKATSEFSRVLRNYETKNIIPGFKPQNEFMIVFEGESYESYYTKLSKIYEELNEVSSNLAVDVFCGYCFNVDECSDADKLIEYSEFAVSNATHKKMTEPVPFSLESFNAYKEQYIKIEAFRLIIQNNLLQYYFQPIVCADTGEIYAYEALMRPQKVNGIQLNPFDVLTMATDEGMLYEIERATIFNTFNYVYNHQNVFTDKKLFINAIPTCLLNDADYKIILDKYNFLFEHIVVEVIESEDILLSTVQLLNERYRKYNANIALDDYGTGYSNESNLLKIQPNYIKIDRSLISDINSNNQKYHLVKNMIGFASQHDITTLAEGVETIEELNTVISLGVNLIQGYYTSKPMPVPLLEIPVSVKEQIIDINLKSKGYINKVYNAKSPNETIDIVSLVYEGFTQINVNADNITIVGEIEKSCDIKIVVPDESEYTFTIKNSNIRGFDGPAIVLGKGSKLSINLSGSNNITYEGIRVPHGSELCLQGDGNLGVSCLHNNGVCIGGNYHQSFGKIVCRGSGNIFVYSNGENIIGIGGGAGKKDSSINIESGSVLSKVKGEEIVAIGTVLGECVINCFNSEVSVSADGQKVVGIGSIRADVTANIMTNVNIKCSGDDCCAIGTLDGGNNKIDIETGDINITVNAKKIVGIGSDNGKVDISSGSGHISVTASGNQVVCIGDINGSGQITLNNCTVKAIANSDNAHTLYIKNGKTIIRSGNIATNDIEPIVAYSQNGDKLQRYMLNGCDKFKESIETENGKYVYSASTSDQITNLYLYLPENFTSDTFDKELLIKGSKARI